MAKAMKLKSDSRTITVRVPISIRKRGGRKVVLTPDDITRTKADPKRQPPDVIAKALARGFRWREMLENTHGTIAEIAQAEKIAETYVGRVLRLTLLSPEVIEELLGGKQLSITLPVLMRPSPIEWPGQRKRFSKKVI